jgi:glutathionyl-hydroquinone reductase
MRKEYVDNVFPHWAAFAEKILKDNDTGFMVGNSLTIADIKWYTFLAHHVHNPFLPSNLFELFDKLNTLFETVNNLDKVKEWNLAHHI